MVTVSRVVKVLVDSKPAIQDAMIENIVNYTNLADSIKAQVEAEMGTDVKRSAIVMALHRYSSSLKARTAPEGEFRIEPEILMKTSICDVCVVRTPTANSKIPLLYDIVDHERGETLNVIQGNNEITLVASQKHLERILDVLDGETILNIEKDLVSLTISLSEDFLYTPGILSLVTRKLAWDNINIFENISTMTEVIFIISERDAVRGFNTFREIIDDNSGPSN